MRFYAYWRSMAALGGVCCLIGAGCREAVVPSKAQNTPEPYEQLLALLVEIEVERMQSLVAQVKLTELLKNETARQSELIQRLAKQDDELKVMQQKYNVAEQEPEWRMNYDGMAYSKERFLQLVALKMEVQEDTKNRLDKYDVNIGEYAHAQQQVAIRIEVQKAKENLIQDNIRDYKRGFDLGNIHKQLDQMDMSKPDIITKVLSHDANDPGGLADRIRREEATTRGIKTSVAEAEAFLKGTGGG